MNILVEEYRELLKALIKYQVNFMLIGGYAVIHYGYDRTTGDLDIWLQTGNDNRNRLVKALKEYGIEDDDIEELQNMDFTNPIPVFFIGKIPRRVDFVTLVSNITFDEAIKEVNHFDLEGKKVPVIHYNHLILTKLSTNRLKDKADIEELERINKFKKK